MPLSWERNWPLTNPAALAGFIPSDGCGIPSEIQTITDLKRRAGAVYNFIAAKKASYALEPWLHPESPTQIIRHPSQIIDEGVGTCVDFTLYFCAACRESRLVSWIVLLKSHALAMVATAYDAEQAATASSLRGRGGDIRPFENNVLADKDHLLDLLLKGRFLAVECTGLTKDPGGAQSRLSFEAACTAGNNLLEDDCKSPEPTFRAAIDLSLTLDVNRLPSETTRGTIPWIWLAQRSNDELRKHFESRPLAIWTKKEDSFPVPVRGTIASGAETHKDLTNGMDLFAWMRHNEVSFCLIHGPGTAGKSSFIMKLVRAADSISMLIVLNLKLYSGCTRDQQRNLHETGDWRSQLSELGIFRENAAGQNLLELVQLGAVMLLVDGLNEIPSEKSRMSTLNLLKRAVAECPNLRVIVTTREPPDTWICKWSNVPPVVSARIATCLLLPLQQEAADEHSDAVNVSPDLGSFSTPFSSRRNSHLDSPFFRDRGDEPFEYLENYLGLNPEQVDVLSELAFGLYKKRKLTFTKQDCQEIFASAEFENQFEEIWIAATDARLIERKGAGFAFEHQVFQDCLAARYLAHANRARATWSAETFDAVTLDKASSDVLAFTLHELTDAKRGDAFLERVYDWNWRHAFKCLRSASRDVEHGQSRWSPEVERAFEALLAEKCNDAVFKTRADAMELRKRLSPLGQATPAGSDKQSRWASKWEFIQSAVPHLGPLSAEHIAMIVDNHSIVGWTAANVVRRFHSFSEQPLHSWGVDFLRGIFRARSESGDAAIRWRIVHALGSFPGPDNADLLLEALSSRESGNEDKWVRYGSARSLVEHAVSLRGVDRTFLLERIKAVCIAERSRPETPVLFELADAALFRGADESWAVDALPYLQAIGEVVFEEDSQYRKSWYSIIDRLEHDQATWNPPSDSIERSTNEAARA